MHQVMTQPLEVAFQKLGWVDAGVALPNTNSANCDPVDQTSLEPCVLRRLLQSRENQETGLNPDGAQAVSRLVESGLSMRWDWPRVWTPSVNRWLGRRLYLSHASNFSPTSRLTCIVSSHIGRHGRQLPAWPALANATLRKIDRLGHRLLIAPGTTASTSLREFSQVAGIPFVSVLWSKHQDLVAWIVDRLLALTNGSDAIDHGRSRLELSPEVDSAAPELAQAPLQDRIAIALCDTVHALAIRPRGTIELLLDARLRDHHFPTASVYIALGSHHRGRSQRSHVQWLDRGAVGWWVRHQDAPPHPWLSRCRRPTRVPTQQLCSPLSQAWANLADTDDWPYLSHCTRSGAGPLPEECPRSFRSRLWLEEEHPQTLPLETLSRICHERLLRGSATMTRTSSRCVSLSAVPLAPLLERRCFRPHLGRWDWEPYGLLIDRRALAALGAQPVIYGEEDDYAQLSDAKQPFFQPFGKEHRSSGKGWPAEREWRIIGDLHLDQLPVDRVCVFVQRRCEALQLSRWCPWRILWISD